MLQNMKKKCKKCDLEFIGNCCKPCRNQYLRERYKNRIKEEAEYRAKWNKENKTKKLEHQKKYRNNNKEKLNLAAQEWQKCNPEKKSVISKRHHEKNKVECNKRSKEWKLKNKDRVLSYAKEYAKNNPTVKRRSENKRRAIKKGSSGSLSNGIIEKLYKLQRGKCACCGKPLGDDYHLDHIMPLALGGENEDLNMQLLTKLCNLQKSAKHPTKFMQERGFLL